MADTRAAGVRVFALAALWGVVVLSIATASGCYGRTCEASVKTWGLNPGEGRLIDPDTWQSSALDEPWLDFPGQRTWIFDMRDLGGRMPQTFFPYISASASPGATGGNFTLGGGNLAEISGASPGRVAVRNGVCADYFLRLVVEAAPYPPSLPNETRDAEVDGEGDDAAVDAGQDGDADSSS